MKDKKYPVFDKARGTSMNICMKALAILLMVTISSIGIGAGSIRIVNEGGTISDHSERIGIPSAWGPPADILFDVPGNDLIVPFFSYAGSSFAMARLNSSMTEMELMLISSSSDRTLNEEVFICRNALIDSQGRDIILRDANGAVYGIPYHDKWDEARSLSPSDIVLTGITGTLSISDVTGDGISDILHLVQNGTMVEIFEGPFPSTKGKSVLRLPSSVDRLISGFDIGGDGVSDIIVWDRSISNPTLMVYNGFTITPNAFIGLDRSLGDIAFGDIDGDGRDDLIFDYPGSLEILPGDRIGSTTSIENDTLLITEGSSFSLEGTEKIICKDLDGDGKDDMIIGVPDHDGGKGLIAIDYGRSFADGFPTALESDAYFIGESLADSIGYSIYLGEDIDGDILPDIFFSIGNDIGKLDTRRNIVPFDVQKMDFVDALTMKEMSFAEFGGSIGITCTASGGNLNRADIIKVDVRTIRDAGSTSSWIYLKETGNATGEYFGTIDLLQGSIPGRSIGVIMYDTVRSYVNGVKSQDLLVLGVAGQEDLPYFMGTPYTITVNESADQDPDINISVRALDPDMDDVEFEIEDKPNWLRYQKISYEAGIHILELSGRPGDGSVGWNNFTIRAGSNSTWVSTDVNILVLNRVPSILATDVPVTAIEGQEYEAEFKFEGTYEYSQFNEIIFSGPVNVSFLELDDFYVKGTPKNRHVGDWEFQLIVYDRSNASSSFNWSVKVENADPVIDDPIIYNAEGEQIGGIIELEPCTIVLPASGRGDGLTTFSIIDGFGSGSLDPLNGTITIPEGRVFNDRSVNLTIRVNDGQGGIATREFSIGVTNQAPQMVNLDELPTTLIAGRRYEIYLITDHTKNDIGASGGLTIILNSNSEIMVETDVRYDGHFVIFPLNRDAGENTIGITLGDHEGINMSNWHWDFTVEEDPDLIDPEIEMDVIGKKGNDLKIDLHAVTNHDNATTMLRILGPSRENIREIPIQDSIDGTYTLDTTDLPDIFFINTTITIGGGSFGREFHEELKVTLGLVKEIDEDNNDLTGWIIFLLLILIIGSLISLLFIERTSLAIQMVLQRGGEVKREEIISTIQDEPGISLTDLRRNSGVSMKDITVTIVDLEKEGMVRSVNDGIKVRFWPMMGSFVDGPLVLNRNQKSIAEVLIDGRRITLQEMVDETGIPSRKLDKEISMMDLKGIVSSRVYDDKMVYYMNSRQRSRVKRSL